MKAIQVGLLGLGTVGAGTFEVLRRNQEEIRRRAGRGIEIGAVCRRDQEAASSATARASWPTRPRWCATRRWTSSSS